MCDNSKTTHLSLKKKLKNQKIEFDGILVRYERIWCIFYLLLSLNCHKEPNVAFIRIILNFNRDLLENSTWLPSRSDLFRNAYELSNQNINLCGLSWPDYKIAAFTNDGVA